MVPSDNLRSAAMLSACRHFQSNLFWQTVQFWLMSNNLIVNVSSSVVWLKEL